MSRNNKSLLTVSGLSAKIGGRAILSDVSLQLDPGECVAIVGGSGAGKSCLLRCIMGLYKPAVPTSGHMIIDGQEISFLESRKKKLTQYNFAFVPQNPQAGLDPLRRLSDQWQQAVRCANRQNLCETGQNDILTSLGLPSFGRLYPHQWSQGMQQRLLIAFSLLLQPKLLILDEPTSALDPQIAARTITSIMNFALEQDIAILIVTHDLALAAKFADRIAVLDKGTVTEFGSTAQFMDNPQSDYGKLLVANRNWHSQPDQRV